jgi:uncharacterized SAM-binding protein YcdF (DUF218 family)
MFVLSQLLSFALQPLFWVVLLMGVAWWNLRRKPRLARMALGSALAMLLFLGWLVPVEAILRRIENIHPPMSAHADLSRYAGIVVLGGALERSPMWKVPGRIALNDHAERMIVPVGLIQQYPTLKLLFTGGTVERGEGHFSESARAKIFFDTMHVPAARLIYEDQSRTTYENAIYSARLPGVDPQAPWLLLTTAAHMPRAFAAFQKAGWNVTPYPVDYKAADETDWDAYSYVASIPKWHYAIHESLGYLMYWVSGRL